MICISLKKGDIVFIEGPCPCGQVTDAMMFERFLLDELEPDERVEVDKGYRQFDPEFAITPSNVALRTKASKKTFIKS